MLIIIIIIIIIIKKFHLENSTSGLNWKESV